MLYNNIPGVIVIEGHVQGLSNTRAVGENNIPVIVMDKHNCLARYSKYCHEFIKCPDFLSENFVSFLIEFSKKRELNDWLLLPSNDHAVYSISKDKSELEKFYKLISPDFEIFKNIYDKTKLLNIAQSCGVSIPVSQQFKNPEDQITANLNFPVITKGRNGLSFYKKIHKKALIATNEGELRKQLKKLVEDFPLEETFTQELIPFNGENKTISFAAFCINGIIKVYWMGVKLREHPIRFGTATLAESIYINDCYKQSVPLIKELKYTGICEIEYLFDPRSKDYKLIEINPRTWLWVGLAKTSGINFSLLAYNYVNGIKNSYKQEYMPNLKWINYFTDTVFSLKAILSKKSSFSTYLKEMKGKKVRAILSFSDLLPGLVFPFLLFSIVKRRR